MSLFHAFCGRVGPVVFPEVKVGVLCPCIVREVVGLVVEGVGASCSRLCCLWCPLGVVIVWVFLCFVWLSLTDSVLTIEEGQGKPGHHRRQILDRFGVEFRLRSPGQPCLFIRFLWMFANSRECTQDNQNVR